jgi:ABC-type antimicrobial peptide transport system permease subunit
MVLLEGAILGLIGGAVGATAAALAIGWGRFSMTMEGMNVEIATDPAIAVAGAAIAVLLGMLAGAVPAIRAARGTIAQGLRAA